MPPKEKGAAKKGKSKMPDKTVRSRSDVGEVSKNKRQILALSETSSVIPDTISQSEESQTVEDSELTTNRAMESVISNPPDDHPGSSGALPMSNVVSSSTDDVFMAGSRIYCRNASGIQLFDDTILSWVSLGPVPSADMTTAHPPT